MTSPTFLRFLLGRELRQLREQAGWSADDVGTELDCSGATVRRIESGRVGVKRLALLKMAELYKVSDEQRDTLLALAKQGTQRGWWARFKDLPPAYGQYIGLESAAVQSRHYESLIVPGLLQTEEYARALILGGRPHDPVDGVELRVRVRMERQAVLDRDDPLRLWAIMDEGALHRQVGGKRVMADQLAYLLTMGERRHVTMQVLPFTAGAYAGMAGAFAILTFDQLKDVAYVEGLVGDLYVDDDDVARYTVVFDHLRAAALSADKSAEMIDRIRAELLDE